MEKLTRRQEEYLQFFAERSGQTASITAASEQFHVAKPTVSKLSKALEDMGLIRKGAYGEIELTELGRAHVKPQMTRQPEAAEWLVSALGLEPDLADQEARTMVTHLQQETVDAILKDWREHPRETELPAGDDLFPGLAVGSYEVPFSVRKRGSRELSMGDRGFRKPARLICGPEGCAFRLYTIPIEYKPLRRSYHGRLARLWYRCGGVWTESVEEPDGSYVIPGAVVIRSDEGPTGMVPIRVRASVNQWTMPESEADLVIDLAGATPVGTL